MNLFICIILTLLSLTICITLVLLNEIKDILNKDEEVNNEKCNNKSFKS